MGASFKTCLFGGFDREDVVKYIEQMSRENQEIVKALEQENETLRSANQEMEQELVTLRHQLQEHLDSAETCCALRRELAEKNESLRSLEQEVTDLRSQALEYQSLKDHIAEIEINAHRRTEEFRKEAIDKLRALLSQQKNWCVDQREKYSEMNTELLEKLDAARQQMAAPDFSAFDQLEQSLNDMENSFCEE